MSSPSSPVLAFLFNSASERFFTSGFRHLTFSSTSSTTMTKDAANKEPKLIMKEIFCPSPSIVRSKQSVIARLLVVYGIVALLWCSSVQCFTQKPRHLSRSPRHLTTRQFINFRVSIALHLSNDDDKCAAKDYFIRRALLAGTSFGCQILYRVTGCILLLFVTASN